MGDFEVKGVRENKAEKGNSGVGEALASALMERVEISAVVEAFNKSLSGFDKNGDGNLSLSELRAFAKNDRLLLRGNVESVSIYQISEKLKEFLVEIDQDDEKPGNNRIVPLDASKAIFQVLDFYSVNPTEFAVNELNSPTRNI